MRCRPALLPLALAVPAVVLAGCSSSSSSSSPLEDVQREVGRLAPALEGFYRGGDYPTQLDEVIASLDEAGLTVADGMSLGGYRYDDQQVEFTLCVEDTSGAWATYDTAPMSVRDGSEAGGCPDL